MRGGREECSKLSKGVASRRAVQEGSGIRIKSDEVWGWLTRCGKCCAEVVCMIRD